MLESLANKIIPKTKFQNTPTKKILITLLVLYFSICNTFLAGIDQDALKKSFYNENRNSISQIINMYSGGVEQLY